MVRKENNRKNIHLDNDIYQSHLYNFNTNISFHQIQEIYNIDPGLGSNMMAMDKDVEMMDLTLKPGNTTNNNYHFNNLDTFQETYDQMNFNIDFDNNEEGLGLRRR
jgi:hypothetical protein